MIADDAVTAAKIGFGGAGTGVWWEEIGRTTLGGAADIITVSSLPARKYLKILAYASGTNIRGTVTFNNDTAANYSNRTSSDNGADAASTGSSAVFAGDTGANNVRIWVELYVINIATTEKLVMGRTIVKTATGAGTSPNRRESMSTWANTADQISRVDFNQTSSGDFAIGSEVVVLGHD